MNKTSEIALRVVLVLTGAFIVYTGIDIAFGGMRTLGWQVPGPFFDVTDQHTFLVQDSHFRFLGGVWLPMGLVLLMGATNLKRYAPVLKLAFVLIFAGGLARISQPDILFDPAIMGSFIAEVVGMPVLYVSLSRVAVNLEESQFNAHTGSLLA
ncbi:MAG: DUF4345 domain-containing protein [Bacteroidetes bacterium]|nr:DUF4345 domain-containing protein [Bacteroidota bacterium]